MKKELISYDPSSGEIVGKVVITPVEEISNIVKRSVEAQKKWGRLSVDKRISYLHKFTEALRSRTQELGELLAREMGKDLMRASGEVSSCTDAVYRAEEVKKAIQTQVFEGYGSRSEMQYNPLGVTAIITPWNYPISMGHWMIIPSLVAGNSVIYKPSEETPLIAQAYVDIFNQFLPEGVLQIVHGADEQGKALVKAKDINLIGFTGSQAVGKDIMRNSADTLKRLVMELGGKDPLIVMEDADINRAAQFAVANSLENSGQMCIATERIYVDSKIADQFEERVVRAAQRYKVGPWHEGGSSLGPIINEKQRSIILTHINDAIDKGARVLLGGRKHPERYIKPTVLADVTPDMLVAKDETFGPVIAISRFDDIEDAIRLANSSEFGLGGSVFGKKGVKEVANRIESGMVGINQGIGGIGDTPWAGAKQSGYGYHGSPDGHRMFTQVRTVSMS